MLVILSIPRSFPSTRYMVANPNMMFTKNVPKSKTLVICQIAKCGTDNL